MVKYVYFLFFFLFSLHISAQRTFTFGARSLALGGASVALVDAYALLGNQAGLANLIGFQAIVAAERRFLVSELSLLAAGAVLPTRSGVFGLAINYFGFQEYNEQKLGLSYARKLGENFSIGAQIDYFNTHILGYGNQGGFTFEVGLQAKILPKVYFAAHIFNPVRAKRTDQEPLPTIFRMGLAYETSQKLKMLAEIEKDISNPPSFKAGIEYHIVTSLYLRTGFRTNPNQISFGMGYIIKKLRLDVAANYHPVLGFTPGVGIVYDKF